ncbi:hypothetical protein BJF79_08605 [Actinomadura sp. CNU-125]|uniref:DUF6879 family protein n=1 Tax=Actinomadura sp. CNU-125 TaxID=1904961 RepID=UPI00095DCEE0|nr:DUF6879 family protein [Actinomadura sp. CNU-125]OLT31845.1 hypothetical protein BJF79_08605 [Actinomadura sp. CNU-125]
MLSEAELEALFDDFKNEAFRLETLDHYAVSSESERLNRYLNGEPLEIEAATREWLEFMAAEIASGKRWYKVHILRSPLSEYLRFECEWGYAVSSQYGQEVFILDETEHARPAGIPNEDFWLFDNDKVARLLYDDEGRFLGAELVDGIEAAAYPGYRDAVMAEAEPFATWWDRHPEHKRENWLGSRS